MIMQSSAPRKYAPPASPRNRASFGRRTKDDLHEWSIYRQNLTSSIAENLFKPNSRDPAENVNNLRYHGDFQMHDSAVESVLLQAKRDEKAVDPANGDVYIRFGLPRVGITNNGGHAVGPVSSRASNVSGDHRRSRSEMDIRRAVVDNSVPVRGPYARPDAVGLLGVPSPETPTSRERQRRFHQSLGGGLDILSNEPYEDDAAREYAASDVGTVRAPLPPGRANMTMMNGDYRGLVNTGTGDVGGTTGGMNGGIHHHHQRAGAPPSESSSYWQSNKRHHHGHYFSNLDLFNQSSAYNYLRYAKADELAIGSSKHPHLLLQDVGFLSDRRSTFDRAMLRSPKYRPVLENVNIELFGGESLAIMHTSVDEVGCLLDMLACQHQRQGASEGACIVNGLRLKPRQLGERVAYVCRHPLYEFLTVRQHLRLLSGIIKPATSSFRTDSMISQLIQTLALAPFHNRLIGELGSTEKHRVKVACQILLDTDVILIEDITLSMDLYDAAFLIDYLRDWALKLNRIVLMACNPPTFELLAMFHKTALLASGRLVYMGKSSKMLEYFESMNFPCPLFKNPCDYYVDLVTHDLLTMEASSESAERIKHLADAWAARAAATLPEPPGAPGVPPPRIKRANCFVVFFWLYYRFWMILCNNPWSYAAEVFTCLLFSILLGLAYFSLPLTQGGINDRFGLFYSLLTLFLVPNWAQNIDRISNERDLVYNDMLHRYYSVTTFYLAKLTFDLPLACISYACYVIPVYFMAELRDPAIGVRQGEIFGIYLGLTLLYCLSLRMLSWLFAYMFSKKFHALASLGLLISIFALSSGVTIHPNDIWPFAQWTRIASPTQWTISILSNMELLGKPPGSIPGQGNIFVNVRDREQDGLNNPELLNPVGFAPPTPVRSGQIQPLIGGIIPPPPPNILISADTADQPLQLACSRRTRYTGILLHAVSVCPISNGEQAVSFANLTGGFEGGFFGKLITRDSSLSSQKGSRVSGNAGTIFDADDGRLLYYIGIPIVAGWGFLGFLLNFLFIRCNYEPDNLIVN